MAFTHHIFTTLFTALIAAYVAGIVESQSTGLGKVYIGTNPSDTTVLYKFSANYPAADLLIPVYVVVTDPSTGQDVAFDNSTILVTCKLTPSGLEGYSNVTFSVSDVAINNETGYNTGKVSFSNGQVGRMTDIQCWGNTPPQFLPSTSISPSKKFSYTAPPTVSPYFPVYGVGQPVWILLSEVALANVTVTCTGTGITFPSSATVVSGSNIVQVLYTATAASASFSCTAQSVSGFQFSSTNSRGATSQMITSPAEAFLYPSVSQLNTLQMTELLVLNQLPNTAVTFTCVLVQVSSPIDADNIIQSPTCPAADPAAEWRLGQTTYTFNQFSALQLVTVTRSSQVSEYTQKMFVIKCCAPSGSQFNESTTASLTYASLYPPFPFNYTSGTDQSNVTTPTPISNPAYVQFGGCYCDLTEGICDTNCCCDTVCTSDDYLAFNCQTRLTERDALTAAAKSRMYCNSSTSYREKDWLPILCIMIENTGFIGFFSYPQTLIINTTYYNQIYNAYTTGYYYSSGQSLMPNAPSGVNYTQSSSIRTGIQRLTTQIQLNRGPNYFLSLPQNVLAGSCSWAAPVSYLVDSSSTCSQPVSVTSCASLPSINALLYATSTSVISSSPFILAAQDLEIITPTIVNYYCDPDGSKYTGSSSTYSDLVPSNETSYFSIVSPQSITGCQFDPITGAYLCDGNNVTETSTSLPPRCGFDGGYQAPPSPTLDSASDICENVVVRVLYNFTWSGQTLTLLNASVVLANVSVASAQNLSIPVTQTFSTTFVNAQTQTSSTSSSSGSATDTATDTTVYPLSGNPGYTKGLRAISGVNTNVTINGTESEQVNTDRANTLRLFNPDASGLCSKSSTADVLFGTNALSGCVLRLNVQDFSNCINLRKLVLSGLDSIMPSGLVSVLGNTSSTNFSNWATVLRENVGSILENTTNNETFSYLSQVQGACINIPSGIHLTILYTQSGLSNYHPIYTIVGAMINYTLSTWSFDCGDGCSPGSTTVQSFVVKSSVNFYQIPPVGTPPPSSWEMTNVAPPYICSGNACFYQTFYPFMKINPGISQSQTLALGLMFIIFGIFLIHITGPVTEWG